MEVILNQSCSTQKDFVANRPISGSVELNKKSIQNGVWTSTIAEAILDSGKCKGSTGGASIGGTCTRYGSGASGVAVITQTTYAKDGGSSANPYIQKIVTMTGVL